MQDGNIARDAVKTTVECRAGEWLVVIPAADIARLGLQDGDVVEVRVPVEAPHTIPATTSTADWFAALDAIGPMLPEGYTFDRLDAYPVRRGGHGRDA